VAAECAGQPGDAIPLYEIVSRTDPGFTTASFGLARCLVTAGERDRALVAYDRVLDSSSSYLDAQTAYIACLASGDGAQEPTLAELQVAMARLQALKLDPARRGQLEIDILSAALELVGRNGFVPDPAPRLGPFPLEERELRFGLERGYRGLAHLAADAGDRIRLIDRANDIRPRTLT